MLLLFTLIASSFAHAESSLNDFIYLGYQKCRVKKWAVAQESRARRPNFYRIEEFKEYKLALDGNYEESEIETFTKALKKAQLATSGEQFDHMIRRMDHLMVRFLDVDLEHFEQEDIDGVQVSTVPFYLDIRYGSIVGTFYVSGEAVLIDGTISKVSQISVKGFCDSSNAEVYVHLGESRQPSEKFRQKVQLLSDVVKIALFQSPNIFKELASQYLSGIATKQH